jgi:hypothetical protein
MSFRRGLRHLIAAALPALLVATGPASATATLTCTVDDRTLGFDVMAAVGHEALSLSGVRGTLLSKREGLTATLGGEDLMQTWIDGEDLRLRFHLFPEEGRPEIDLVVVTRRRTETDHVGRYRLTIGRDTPRRGAVTCVVG